MVSNQVFLDNLHVLMVSYFNLGMCQLKIVQTHQMLQESDVLPKDQLDLLYESKSTFQQGLDIGARFLGANNYFTAKLKRKAEIVNKMIEKGKTNENNGSNQNDQEKPEQHSKGFEPSTRSIL